MFRQQFEQAFTKMLVPAIFAIVVALRPRHQADNYLVGEGMKGTPVAKI